MINLCWRNLMTFTHREWHLIQKWLLSSIFTQFSQQLLKGLPSWGYFGKHLMIDCYMTDAFVLPILEHCSAAWFSTSDSHLKLLDHVLSGAIILTGVCLSVTLHVVNLWQYYLCCIRSVVTWMYPLHDALKKNGKVFYGQAPPSRESTTTEYGVNYQPLAVIYSPQPAKDNGLRNGRSNWLVAPLTLMGSNPWAPRIAV